MAIYLLLESFVDHRKSDKALSLGDLLWMEGSIQWEKLLNLQDLEYIAIQGIEHEPAFNWWVHHVFN